ncbi:hypothetical protein PMAYCL1PPCAC_25513, partial [Pristionchus mayeri]
ADNSNIVLRWEIRNVREVHRAGRRVASKVFNEGGFKWIASFEKNENGEADLSLHCDTDHNGPWKFEADVFTVIHSKKGMQSSQKERVSFDAGCKSAKVDWQYWDLMVQSDYNINGTFTVEFNIHIIPPRVYHSGICQEGVPLRGDSIANPETLFATPNHKSNVILKIGEKKLHVYKEYLAFHSPVFDILFFGDFAEKNNNEVEIKDVVYEEFLDLLHLIYFRDVDITDRSVSHIVKLADRFQMERLMKEAEKYLIQASGIEEAKKIMIADQYRLDSLK